METRSLEGAVGVGEGVGPTEGVEIGASSVNSTGVLVCFVTASTGDVDVRTVCSVIVSSLGPHALITKIRITANEIKANILLHISLTLVPPRYPGSYCPR